MKTYDLVVIGGGAAGLVASKFAAGLGKKVALVEKNKLGGTCTLTGCIPSKTLINAARVAYQTKRAAVFGFAHPSIPLNPTRVLDHVQDVVQQIYQTHTPEILAQLGIDVYRAAGTFEDSHTLSIGSEHVHAQKYIIATGTCPFIPAITGLSEVNYLTNETVFALKEIPKSLVILGAGPVGMELACAFNRLGATTTVIELHDTILPKQDRELVTLLTQELQQEQMTLLTHCRADAITQTEQQVHIRYTDLTTGESKTLSAEKLLIASGRKPALETLGLDKAGVIYTPKSIVVDSMLRTSQPHIFACGDVVGPYQFSHMAEYQASIATRNALIPFFKQKVDYTHVTWATFTDPEIACAGLTEYEARERYGDSIKIYRQRYSSNDRARTDQNTTGLAKFICTKNGTLVGAQILGVRAGELINEVQVGKYYAKKLSNFYPVIHAYPTYSEIIWHASKKAYVNRFADNFFLKFFAKLFGFKIK